MSYSIQRSKHVKQHFFSVLPTFKANVKTIKDMEKLDGVKLVANLISFSLIRTHSFGYINKNPKNDT